MVVPGVLGQVLDARDDARASAGRVVDHGVEAAEPIDGQGHGTIDVARPGHVAAADNASPPASRMAATVSSTLGLARSPRRVAPAAQNGRRGRGPDPAPPPVTRILLPSRSTGVRFTASSRSRRPTATVAPVTAPVIVAEVRDHGRHLPTDRRLAAPAKEGGLRPDRGERAAPQRTWAGTATQLRLTPRLPQRRAATWRRDRCPSAAAVQATTWGAPTSTRLGATSATLVPDERWVDTPWSRCRNSVMGSSARRSQSLSSRAAARRRPPGYRHPRPHERLERSRIQGCPQRGVHRGGRREVARRGPARPPLSWRMGSARVPEDRDRGSEIRQPASQLDPRWPVAHYERRPLDPSLTPAPPTPPTPAPSASAGRRATRAGRSRGRAGPPPPARVGPRRRPPAGHPTSEGPPS